MILIPVIGRTRSSVVAGIFHICGAWVGTSTVSWVNKYDTFENWDVISHLQKTYGKTWLMDPRNARKEAPKFRRFLQNTLPHDKVICLKFVYYYEPLFRLAFPESEFFFVSRIDNLKHRKHGTDRYNDYIRYARGRDGTWIDTTWLVDTLPQMKAIIDAHPSLVWREKEVRHFIRTGVDEKFKEIKKVERE